VEPASLAAMSPRRRSRSFRPSAGQLQLGDAIRAFRGGSDGGAGVYGALTPGGHECCSDLDTGCFTSVQVQMPGSSAEDIRVVISHSMDT
jgi:hypothetical protein